MASDVVSRIDLKVTGGDAADKAAVSLDRLAASNDGVVVSIDRSTKVREREVSAIERIAKAYDVQYRAEVKEADALRVLDRARASGLAGTESYQRALAALTRAQNDNTKSVGLARHEWINLSRQFQDIGVSLAGGQSPLTVLFQQGSQVADIFSSSRGGAGAAIRAFGEGALRAMVSPLGAAAALTAAVIGLGVAGNKAAEAFAKLGEQARLTGLSANEITGAQIVGARSGLDEKASTGAFESASKQFEQFARNEGAVKSALDRIDAGFLKVADRARSAGEFIDIIERKIRDLPRAEGLNLAQAMFGDDAGKRLFDEIERGGASMEALRRAASDAGASFDASAQHAERMRREIAEAEQIASTRLLSAFGDLSEPVLALERAWVRMKMAMVEIAQSAPRIRDALTIGAPHAAGGEPASDVFARMRNMNTFGRLIPLSDSGIPGAEAVGASRARYEARAEAAKASRRKSSSGESDAFRFEETIKDLQTRIDLARAEGVEYERLDRLHRVQNEQRRLGVKATQEQKDAVGGLAGALYDAEREARRYNEAMQEVANLGREAFGGMIQSLREGDSIGKAFVSTLERIGDRLADLALDFAFSGIGGRGRGTSGGGILGSLFGSVFGGGTGSVAPFADGGVVGAPGGKRVNVPMSAFIGAPHFASGGAVPVIAHAGEVILNAAQQRSVAAALTAARGSSNDNRGTGSMAAAPVTVNLIGAPQGTKVQETRDSSGGRRIDIVMDERIAAANASPQGAEGMAANFGVNRRVARR
jgi:hypothetical protein